MARPHVCDSRNPGQHHEGGSSRARLIRILCGRERHGISALLDWRSSVESRPGGKGDASEGSRQKQQRWLRPADRRSARHRSHAQMGWSTRLLSSGATMPVRASDWKAGGMSLCLPADGPSDSQACRGGSGGRLAHIWRTLL